MKEAKPYQNRLLEQEQMMEVAQQLQALKHSEPRVHQEQSDFSLGVSAAGDKRQRDLSQPQPDLHELVTNSALPRAAAPAVATNTHSSASSVINAGCVLQQVSAATSVLQQGQIRPPPQPRTPAQSATMTRNP